MWKGAPDLMSSEYLEKRRVNMTNPYREGTKLHRIFAFMQDGCWHPLHLITQGAYGLTTSAYLSVSDERRVASALRTIRSHKDLDVRYNGERYRMILQPIVPPRCQYGTPLWPRGG